MTAPRHRIGASTIVVLALFALASLLGGGRSAYASDPGGGSVYSQQQVANLFANSGNSYLAANAASFAAVSHNVENTTGSTSNYNGSCCTGLMQMNTSNLQTYCSCTPTQYGQMSGADQIAVYSSYMNDVMKSSSIQQLQAMQASGQSLGGQPVDGAMIAACAQLGTGNCAKAISNGCAGVSSAQGGDGSVSICTMAAKADNGGLVNPDGSVSTPGTSTASGSSSSSTSTSSTILSQADIPANKCWACEAVSKGFSLMDMLTANVPKDLANRASLLMATIFALVLTVVVGKEILGPFVGAGGPQTSLSLLFRFMIMMMIITSGTLYTDYIQGYGQEFAIGIGGQIAQQVSTAAMSAFKITPSNGQQAPTP